MNMYFGMCFGVEGSVVVVAVGDNFVDIAEVGMLRARLRASGHRLESHTQEAFY